MANEKSLHAQTKLYAHYARKAIAKQCRGIVITELTRTGSLVISVVAPLGRTFITEYPNILTQVINAYPYEWVVDDFMERYANAVYNQFFK